METRLENLLRTAAGASAALILPHNDPDPDAIASAVALRYLLQVQLGLLAEIAFKGLIGRAENRALVRYLGYPLQVLSPRQLRQATFVALVDTQPGAGNNPLPLDRPPAIVIDHHVWREGSASAIFADVRPELGASSTMLAGYLKAAGIKPPKTLATALFYGIKTDTMALGRGAGPQDAAAYYELQPQVDIEALTEIERAQVPAAYFRSFVDALQAAKVFGNVVLSYVGSMSYPDLAAEVADLLLRLEGIRWVICQGVYKEELILAVRTRSRAGGAGDLVRAIVKDRGMAGGHGTMAGGHVPLQGEVPEAFAQQLGQRALAYLDVAPDVEGRPLI